MTKWLILATTTIHYCTVYCIYKLPPTVYYLFKWDENEYYTRTEICFYSSIILSEQKIEKMAETEIQEGVPHLHIEMSTEKGGTLPQRAAIHVLMQTGLEIMHSEGNLWHRTQHIRILNRMQMRPIWKRNKSIREARKASKADAKQKSTLNEQSNTRQTVISN